jgi:uncharacterized flavoprotein (TIGR03862 family)
MTPPVETTGALVIGAGPAGLMAAEVLAAAGQRVIVAEAKPSVGRKFLMAGKSGLNLTKAEPVEDFIAAYAEARPWLGPMLEVFGPDHVRDWARGLGQEVFAGTTGRVFPTAMKASPLLRAWLARLGEGGVDVRRRWRWRGWQAHAAVFDTPEGERRVRAGATVLALGGASWARLGSDGHWAETLAADGVALAPFAPANVGLRVEWSDHMARHYGAPVKGAALIAGGRRSRGEFVVSARGIEGGGVYAMSRAIREGAALRLDLCPSLTEPKVAARLSGQGKASLSTHLRKALRLDPVRIALAREWGGALPRDPELLAARLKALPVPHQGLRPMDEAISTAGGVSRAALTGGLMLRARPGVFCAGEMLDWEAPTGGYLITGCLATGRWAGLAALRWLTGAPAEAMALRLP